MVKGFDMGTRGNSSLEPKTFKELQKKVNEATDLDNLHNILRNHTAEYGFDLRNIAFLNYGSNDAFDDGVITGSKNLPQETWLISWDDDRVLLHVYDESKQGDAVYFLTFHTK